MKTKALISFAVTAKLICYFVFAYAKSRFSHDAAHIILCESCFDCITLKGDSSNKQMQPMSVSVKYSLEKYMSLVKRKPAFCICENIDADQLAVTPKPLFLLHG